MARFISAFVWSASLLLVLGCGDDSTPPCSPGFGAADACGGGLEGTWTYRAACTDTQPTITALLDAVCSGTTAGDLRAEPAGTLSVTGATFVLDVTTTMRLDVRVPSRCAIFGGGCAGVVELFRAVLPGGRATCHQAGDACACGVSYPVKAHLNGPISTSGGEAHLAGAPYHYCVQESTLTYRAASQGAADSGFTFVLTRQD